MKQYEKSKFNLDNYYKPKYNFIKMNKDLDIKKIINDIWVLKFWYLKIIEMTSDSKNRIHFDDIELSESNKRTLEAFFKKKWFIWKFKLKWDSKKVLYLNPLYSHQWKTISKELFEAFNSINNKIY